MRGVFLPFPLPLSGKQWFYLGFFQGFGAGIIDFGANFGIAYAMYHHQKVVKMWVFSQNTIAGDLGVTPIIQCLASMLITSSLVHTDLHSHQIQPLPFCYPHVEHLPDPRSLFSRRRDSQPPPTPKSLKRQNSSGTAEGTIVGSERAPKSGVEGRDSDLDRTPEASHAMTGLQYYYWMLVRFIFEGTENNMMFAKPGLTTWLGRLLWTAAQGAAIGIVFGFPLWCLAVVILGPIYGTRNMGGKWAPQVIKGVYGAVVGWVTNPVIATLALGSQAEHHLIVVEHDAEKGGAGRGVAEEEGGNEQGGMEELVPTIHEGEELDATRLSPRRLDAAPQTPVLPGSRRASSASASLLTRPPLTANVSHLGPLPSDAFSSPFASGQPSRARGDSAAGSSTHSTWTRPRGNSTAESTRSYSYALGGTGGRAQRSRSNTAISVPPVLVLGPPVEGRDEGLSEEMGYRGNEQQRGSLPGTRRTASGAAAWDVFGRRGSAGWFASETGAPALPAAPENREEPGSGSSGLGSTPDGNGRS